ncbi:MAG: YihY/virulence factor BrkB family protein [Ectothiorhodospiraceae bacterium]|jgi:membrane protein
MRATALQEWFVHHVVECNTAGMPRWQRAGVLAARIGYAVTRDLAQGQLTLRAMSLVYTTLLSLVPLLAVSFSLLKAFGVHNQIEPALAQFLAPLGPQGAEITRRTVEFVENIRVGVLGALGLAMLLYTVIGLMQKIEEAFNVTWRVSRSRSLAQRFSDYLSVLLVGPVLVFSAIGITASVLGSELVRTLSAVEPLGVVIDFAAALTPYVLIIAAFTFVYVFVPNTRVRLRSALLGAVVAGLGWQTTGWVFGSVIVVSGRYTAVYSAFATLIFFMLWLYLSWLILLVGASIAYYHQNPRRVQLLGDEPRLSPRLRERIGLAAMALIARRQYAREPMPGAQAIADELRLPQEPVTRVLDGLAGAGILAHCSDRDEAYLPAAPLDTTTVVEVLGALRRQDETTGLDPRSMWTPQTVEDLIGTIDATVAARLDSLTIKELGEHWHGDMSQDLHTAAASERGAEN